MDEAALKTLVVDDEPLATERLQLLLARIGGIDLVGTASDGESACRMAEALRPDLLLLDIAMPGMDGIDVARELGALGHARPAGDLRHRLRPVRGLRLRGRGGRLSGQAGRSQAARTRAGTGPRSSRQRRDGSADEAARRGHLSRRILGLRPQRSGPHPRDRHRPGVGRARLHAASCRSRAAG